MLKELKFSRLTTFTGRNGTFKCAGVELIDYTDRVQISPVTSKGNVGRCDIDIPVEDIPALIEALQDIARENYDQIPHGPTCAKRVHGAAECDCIKAELMPT